MLPNFERRGRLSVTTGRPSSITTTTTPLSSSSASWKHATAVGQITKITTRSAAAAAPSTSSLRHHRSPRRSIPASWIRSVLLSCCLMAVSISAHQPTVIRNWPSLQQELSDELNDAQQLRAVQTSVKEWERHRQATSHRTMHNRVRRADKSVCYGDLGCFEDSGPFGYLDMLPSSPEEINTKFLFYSTKNRSDRPLIEIPYLNMTDAWKVFQPQSQPRKAGTRSWEALRSFQGLDVLSVRVIVHGFGSSCPHVWIYELRTALMAVEDCVVICVDWELGANLPNYVRAAANTRLIGKQLAMFLRGLQQYKGLDLSRVHIIGFSLGAHVSGFAGAELPGISRITGLDPAGPLFESQHPKARLDSTDATFVDVIHSNGENLILGGLGSWQPMGHVDFYPNGGRVQHGCSNLFVGAVTDFIWSPAAAVEGRSLCNHRRAYKFFIDSVAPRCLFPAFPCDSYDDFLKGNCFPCDQSQQDDPEVQAKCGNMGYYADRSTGRGQLYLNTREEEPFCAHQFNIEIYSSENDLPLRTLGRLEAILTGDGTLNETFSITEKDDTEFFAGEKISRILVPHPALGFPHAITMRYKSYSGWLSKGLAQWTIQKLVLTDSFGAKRSICRPDISLVSDRYVYLDLHSGECELPEESSSTTDATDLLTTTTDPSSTSEPTERSDLNKLKDYQYSTTGPYDDDVDRLREKKEIIKLGSSYKISANTNEPESKFDGNERLPWQPLLENSIDEGPKVFTDEKQNKLSGHESGRSISDSSILSTTKIVGPEINEPILKSTTQRVSSSTPAEDIRPRENSYFTIQLLPFRLGEFIERAERYARETLFPLFSEAPARLFGLGQSTTTTTSSSAALKSNRQPKYFPSLGELTSSDNNGQALESRRSQRRVDLPPAFNPTLTIEQPVFYYDRPIPNAELDPTTKPPESRTEKESVVLEEGRSSKSINLLRPSPVNVERSRSISEESPPSPYYTSELDALAGPNPVRIELPTYKPPIAFATAKPNDFPYPFESIDHTTSSTVVSASLFGESSSTSTASSVSV